MGTWNSRGLRGSTFEELINMTNDIYTEKNLALVQKIPTPKYVVFYNGTQDQPDEQILTLSEAFQKSKASLDKALARIKSTFAAMKAKVEEKQTIQDRHQQRQQICFSRFNGKQVKRS